MIIKIRDPRGILIKFLICVIIWYTEAIQTRFFVINNFLLLTAALLAVSVVWDVLQSGRKNFLNMIPKAGWLVIVYVLLTLVVGFIAAPVVSAHISRSIFVVEIMLIMVFVCYYCVSRETVDFLIKNYIFMSLFMCLLFVYEPQLYENSLDRYSYSSTTNPNTFALILNTGMWAILYYVSRKKLNIAVGLGLCALYLYAIFLTGSRKGLISAAICLVCWFVLCYPLIPKGNIRKRLMYSVLVVILVCAGIAILKPLYAETSIAGRLKDLLEEGDDSRNNLYRIGWELIRRSPWIGHGFWGFAYYHLDTYSHSTLIEIPVSSGIPLAMVYFYSYWDIFKNLCKSKLASALHYKVDMRQGLVMFAMLMFNVVCVIHIYTMTSLICFGIIMSLYTIWQKRALRGDTLCQDGTNC